MNILSGLTSQPRQTANFSLAGGVKVYLYLEYSQISLGWYLNFTYEGVEVSGLRLCASPNILRQWRHLTGWGLAVITTDGFDPAGVGSLADGTTSLCILSEEEVAQLEAKVFTRG